MEADEEGSLIDELNTVLKSLIKRTEEMEKRLQRILMLDEALAENDRSDEDV